MWCIRDQDLKSICQRPRVVYLVALIELGKKKLKEQSQKVCAQLYCNIIKRVGEIITPPLHVRVCSYVIVTPILTLYTKEHPTLLPFSKQNTLMP